MTANCSHHWHDHIRGFKVCCKCRERIYPCNCGASTGICGFITRGTGRLDPNGYFEHPCTHGNDMVQHEDDWRRDDGLHRN